MASSAKSLAGYVPVLVALSMTTGCLSEVEEKALGRVAKTVQTTADRPYAKSRLRQIVRRTPLDPAAWGKGFQSGAAAYPLLAEDVLDRKCRLTGNKARVVDGYKRPISKPGSKPIAGWTGLMVRTDVLTARRQLAKAKAGTRNCPDASAGGSRFLGERLTPMAMPAGVDEMHAVEGTAQNPGAPGYRYVYVLVRKGRFVGFVMASAWEIELARAEAPPVVRKLVARLDRQLNG